MFVLHREFLDASISGLGSKTRLKTVRKWVFLKWIFSAGEQTV